MGDSKEVANGHCTANNNHYSKPHETAKVFNDVILHRPLIAKDIPQGTYEAARHINFTGVDGPSIPVNWRFAEACASLNALEATLVNVLLKQKYSIDFQDVIINTEKASLFIFSAMLWTVDIGGENISPVRLRAVGKAFEKYFPSCDVHNTGNSLYRSLVTNIYRCSDGNFFNSNASLDPNPTLESTELPHDMEVSSFEEGVEVFKDAVGKIDSEEMQRLTSEIYRQAGTICNSIDEFLTSAHGKANENIGLWEIYDQPNPSQPPSWWPDAPFNEPCATTGWLESCRFDSHHRSTCGHPQSSRTWSQRYEMHLAKSTGHKRPARGSELGAMEL